MNIHSLSSRRSGLAAATMLASTLVAGGAVAQSLPVAPGTTSSARATAPAATDIRDIRGPKPIASPWMVPLIAISALLMLSGAYGAWAWNHRRLRETSKGPLDIALLRLAKARELMTPTLGREFSIVVSSTVRDYIESRFDVRASHLTTHEFLHQFLEPEDALLTTHRSLLDNFLHTCDLAKFGGWNLAAEDMEAMLESARRFVVESAVETRSARVQSAATAATDHHQTSVSRDTYVSLPST